MFDRILNALITLAAVSVAFVVVKNQIYRGGGDEAVIPEDISVHWEAIQAAGMPLDDNFDAPVTLAIFGDLECPACRFFHSRTLSEIKEKHSESVHVIYLHYPLEYHRFAMPAARGWECAHASGLAAQWADLVYQKQDSLGLKSWASYASEAGIDDIEAFEECTNDARTDQRIRASVALAQELAMSGTPSFVLNGWKLNSVPSYEEFVGLMVRASRGEDLN